ncbi:hypothetical protein evm_013902 [Chilo suppressalis]|nr:hypothetical protein evm_013902 [Chilo suppressalis]
MTGGGKPPSRSTIKQRSSAVVDAILGPALEGVSNIYDSDACGSVIKDFVELHHPVDNTFILEDNAESEKNKENIEFSFLSMDEVRQPNNKDDGEVEKSLCQASTSKGILNENNENDTWSTWTPKEFKNAVIKRIKVFQV